MSEEWFVPETDISKVSNGSIKVSVIIPVYNVEDYLTDCLNSVLNQTLQQIEIICINDASTDNSLSILKTYVERDDRIKIIQMKQNQGLSAVRNSGLSIAEGEYIYFLDSDDMIVKDCLERLYNVVSMNGVDVCFFDADVIYENGNLEKQFKNYASVHKIAGNKVVTGETLFTEFIMNSDWSPSTPREFFRREYLIENNLRFEQGIIHEDALFSFLAVMKAEKALYLPEILFLRRFRPNSTMTSTKSIQHIRGLFICICKVLEELKYNKYSNETGKAVTTYLESLLVYAKAVRSKIDDIPLNIFEDKYYQFLFDKLIEGKDRYYCLSDESIKNAQKARRVYVFGAGEIAKIITQQLSDNNIMIEAYVVSNTDDNVKVFFGHPVIDINQIKSNSMVIIAVAERHQSELVVNLNSMGNYEIECAQSENTEC